MEKRKTLTLKGFAQIPTEVKKRAVPNGNTEIKEPFHPRAHTVGKPDENIFVVHNGASLGALTYWLQTRKYNAIIESKDKTDNTIFGLAWDFELGKFPSYNRRKRGVIQVIDKDFVAKAGEIIACGMRPNNEIGIMERKAKIDLYKYGRE